MNVPPDATLPWQKAYLAALAEHPPEDGHHWKLKYHGRKGGPRWWCEKCGVLVRSLPEDRELFR